MQLEFAFPEDVKKAKDNKWPLVIPAGNIEYHGSHCVFGCDTLISLGLLRELEKKRDIMIAPRISYGPSSYAVSGPEKGTIDVDLDDFESYIYNILKAYLYGGWKNIYVLIHHQYDQERLFPMTLCYLKAAKKLTFEYLEELHGRGWYSKLNELEDRWDWFTVLPTMSKEVQQQTGYDHAGKWECSLLQALYPDTVKIDRIKDSDEWFVQEAVNSTEEIGENMIKLCIEDLRDKIK